MAIGERRKWVGVEWGGVWGGVSPPLPSRLEGLGSVVSSPSRVRGRAPAGNGFWRILIEDHRTLLFVPI